MAKTNIIFNNKNYSIDDASLSAATAALKSHFSTVMNGTGAVINLGGTAYNVDSAKLSAATNAFVQHLGTIAGNGYKVVINGVEYSIDAAKVADAIAQLGATWEGTQTIGFPIIWNTKDVMGNTTVVFNEFQFVKVSDFAPSYEELAETILVVSNDITTSVQSVESYGNNVLAAYYEVIIASISEAGEIPEFGITFPETGLYAIDLGSRGLDFDIGLWTSDLYPLNGEVYCYGDYKYTYNNGWSVDINEEVVDRNQASYGVILENIKGKPVTNMVHTFTSCTNLTTAPVIPASVKDMTGTFQRCSKLTEAPVIPASVTNMDRTFSHCTDLIGAIEINANPPIYNACFDQVDMSNITLTGASTRLNEIGATGLNWTPIA